MKGLEFAMARGNGAKISNTEKEECGSTNDVREGGCGGNEKKGGL